MSGRDENYERKIRREIDKMLAKFAGRMLSRAYDAIYHKLLKAMQDGVIKVDEYGIEMDPETFRKIFPALAEEVFSGVAKCSISGVRSEGTSYVDELRNPDVISFIRRAKSVDEALEVIDFLEKRGEISKEYADRLRKQLREKGLESFGPRKEPGYYIKRYYKPRFYDFEEED
ncbi:MAG: DUF2095 family protein [Candidatus Baldrarchaeia archaeon]